MLSNRQVELLKLIVEEYIKTVKPIGSKSLCKKMKCSSATIRNEMGVLEDLGLLEKTHTSSGRVPSEKRYRYYVDNIMKPKELSGEDMLKLQTVFHNKSLVLSDAITKSMEIISELTNYTCVILGDTSNENKVSKVEAVPISDNDLIAIVITDKGHVENKNIVLEENVTVEEVKPIIGKYVKQHEVLYNAFYNAFSDFTSDPIIKMSGTKNILMQPEFNDIDKIRDIIGKFEDKDIVSNIKEDKNGINIYIGSESEFDNDVSIIKTRYTLNGEEGTIALIGPKRMEYDRVTTLLNYILDNIDK